MDYSFNAKVAEKYGVEEAVLLHNLYWWISKNKANNKHIYDGRVWTYNSRKAFAELFPFWTEKQLRRICNSLEKNGAIIVGNYNKSPMDRTMWYALSEDVLALYGEEDKTIKNIVDNTICPNGQMQMPKKANANDQSDTCKCLDGQMQVPKKADVTDIITNNKPNINSYITPLPPNLTKSQQSLLGMVVSCEGLTNEMKFQIFKWLAYKKYKYDAVSIEELLLIIKQHITDFGEEQVINVLKQSIANLYVGIAWNMLKGTSSKNNSDVRQKRTYEGEYY